MSRRKKFLNRTITSDYIYNSKLVSKFINILMIDGKKSIARKILYKTLNILSINKKKKQLDLLELAINNVKPIVEVRSRRVGGTTYQIPVEIKPSRSCTLAIRWIIFYAKKRSNKYNMCTNLTNELLDILDKKGNSIKKKDEVHRIAESNKAFAHYRW